jgi:hypothetical protein
MKDFNHGEEQLKMRGQKIEEKHKKTPMLVDQSILFGESDSAEQSSHKVRREVSIRIFSGFTAHPF